MIHMSGHLVETFLLHRQYSVSNFPCTVRPWLQTSVYSGPAAALKDRGGGLGGGGRGKDNVWSF